MDSIPYKKTEPMMGAFLFIVSRKRYLAAAVEHAAWLNLQAPDLRKKYFEGTYGPVTESTKKQEFRRYESLRRQLWCSFIQVATLVVLVLVVAWSLGLIGWSLPLDLVRLLGFIGTALIAWAALFELGGLGLASWKGQTLSEIVHPRIFQILFIPGTLSLLCRSLF